MLELDDEMKRFIHAHKYLPDGRVLHFWRQCLPPNEMQLATALAVAGATIGEYQGKLAIIENNQPVPVDEAKLKEIWAKWKTEHPASTFTEAQMDTALADPSSHMATIVEMAREFFRRLGR